MRDLRLEGCPYEATHEAKYEATSWLHETLSPGFEGLALEAASI